MKRHSRLNRIYDNMKSRCYNPNMKNYKYYGGRGITICKEWLNSEKITKSKIIHNHSLGWIAFKEWAFQNGYNDKLTLDRIDVNKGYSPENCRWVTQKQQCNNKNNNHLLTYNGETKTLKQWSEKLNINYNSFRSRIRRGWSIKDCIEN